MIYWVGFGGVLLVGLALLGGALALYRRRWPAGGRLRPVLENITLVLLGILMMFMALEFYFKVFFAQTDGYTFTLAAQNWEQKYWYPVNALGYRDRDWRPEDVTGKTKVMVVGDSFAAGTGIKNYENRFSNQLGQLLGTNYVVFTVASPGWSTQNELKAMLAYPYKPDIIILSYFINDIEQTAYDQGVERPEFVRRPEGVLGFVVNNSYVLNFFYWRWYRLTQPIQKPTYIEWLTSLYQNPKIGWQHQQELQAIIEGTASEQIPLVVVVFPSLNALAESQTMTGPVINLFQQHHIAVLDVGALLAGRNQAELIVNSVDAHPNEAVHQEIARQLYQILHTDLQEFSK